MDNACGAAAVIVCNIINPLRVLRVVLTRLLFDERWRTLLLLAHLLLLHGRSCLLRILSALAIRTLCQVASQIDLHLGSLHNRISLVSRHVMLN